MKKSLRDQSQREATEILINNRINRSKLIDQFGEPYTSVWDVDPQWRQAFTDLKSSGKEYKDIHDKNISRWNLERFPKELREIYAMRGKTIRAGEALSVLPLDITTRCLLYYSQEGDQVINPCMGDTTTLAACMMLGRTYNAFDVSDEMVMWNQKAWDILKDSKALNKGGGAFLWHKPGELCLENVQQESQDLLFTCPPYWDIEDYGENPGQAEAADTYEEFLENMARIYDSCYHALKPGAFACVIVNDFRKDKIFYPYHADTLRILQQVGFNCHDMIIMKYASSIQSMFTNQLYKARKVAKIHEYILVMRK